MIVEILDKQLSLQNPLIFLAKLMKSIRKFDFCYYFFTSRDSLIPDLLLFILIANCINHRTSGG